MAHTFENEMAEAIRECLMKLSGISRRMSEEYAEMEKSVALADHNLDRALEKADIAQRREIDLTDENQRLREDNARLRGEFQIVSDTASRASVGAQISRNLRNGTRAFEYGEPHKSVNADIVGSIERLKVMEDAPPIPFEKIEREMALLLAEGSNK